MITFLTNETYVPITLTTQFHVDTQFTTADLATSMDMFKTRILKPSVATVANKIDRDGTTFAYQNIPNAVGTPGAPPAAFLPFTIAGAILSAEAAPMEDRHVILDPFSMAYAQDGVKGLYNPQNVIGEQVKKGMIQGQFAGFEGWYMDQNVVSYTVGAGGGTAPALTNNTSSAWLATGWAATGVMETGSWTSSAAARVTVGDIITVTGAVAANPQSRGAYGNNRLRQFVVIPPGATLTSGTYNTATGVYSSTSGGALSLWVKNVGIYGGQFQNIAAVPSSSAAIQVWGQVPASTSIVAGIVSPQGIAMHRDCFALAFADLDLPDGVDMAARAVDEEGGINFRCVRQYTINNDALPMRVDVLYGYGSLYPEFGVKIAG